MNIQNKDEQNGLGKAMKRSEFWRTQYHVRRYMEHMKADELAQRMRDIFCNLMVLLDSGKVGLRPLKQGGAYWMEKFTHVQEEYRLRNLEFPDNMLKGASIPKPTYPQPPKSAAAVFGRTFEPGKFLVKYGKFCYLESMFKEGAIRIAPASLYKDPSLNRAVQDDELSLTRYSLPSEVQLQALDKSGQPIQKLIPLGNLSHIDTCRTNYYVYCLSYFYENRLFGDFEADCCIIVTQPYKFLALLENEFRKAFPEWISFQAAVNYVDPFERKKREDDILFFSKHFRYAYQYEYRIVWLPRPSKFADALGPVYLRIGSLEGMAELIVLESSTR